jgi:hypothetical protein
MWKAARRLTKRWQQQHQQEQRPLNSMRASCQPLLQHVEQQLLPVMLLLASAPHWRCHQLHQSNKQ